MRRGAMRPPWSHLEPSCAVCAAPERSRSSAARFCSLLGPAADGAFGFFVVSDFLLAIGVFEMEELYRCGSSVDGLWFTAGLGKLLPSEAGRLPSTEKLTHCPSSSPSTPLRP